LWKLACSASLASVRWAPPPRIGKVVVARDIPVGNGTLLVMFDTDSRIRDFYFPHVGRENHTVGHPSRFGFFVDGRFSWVGPQWRPSLSYHEDTLVTDVRLRHDDLALEVACRDAVDFHENVYLREVAVRNLTDRARPVKVVFSHDFHVGESEVGNTVHHHVRPDGGAGVAGAARGAGRHGEPRRGVHEFEFACQMGMIRGKLVVEEEGPDHD